MDPRSVGVSVSVSVVVYARCEFGVWLCWVCVEAYFYCFCFYSSSSLKKRGGGGRKGERRVPNVKSDVYVYVPYSILLYSIIL